MLEIELAEAFINAHPADAARCCHGLQPSSLAASIASLSREAGAKLLAALPIQDAGQILRELEPGDAADLLAEFSEGAAVIVLRSTERPARERVLSRLPASRAKNLRQLLSYADGTAGALMVPDVWSVLVDATVQDALSAIRRQARFGLYYVYVVSVGRVLEGVISVRELLAARPEQPLAGVIQAQVETLTARASWEQVLTHPGWQRYQALPVVDAERRLLGVVRFDSLHQRESSLWADPWRKQDARAANAIGALYATGARALVAWGVSLVSNEGEE